MEFPGGWAFPIATSWLSVLRNRKCSSSHGKSNAFLKREWKHMVSCLSYVHRVNMDRYWTYELCKERTLSGRPQLDAFIQRLRRYNENWAGWHMPLICILWR